MELQPPYYIHREETLPKSYGYDELFLALLVLRRRPTYASHTNQRYSAQNYGRRRRCPTTTFLHSAGLKTTPIGR